MKIAIYYKILFVACVIVSYTSCKPKAEKDDSGTQVDSSQTNIDSLTENINSDLPPDSVYLTIKGDWDGDGKEEVLKERYFSRTTGRNEVAPSRSRIADSLEYDELIDMAINLNAMSYLVSDNNKIDTLFISTADSAQTFGVMYLKNEGDMDGDGADELGYIPAIAQMSTLTSYYIMSYKNGKWVHYFSFPIWSWMDDFDSLAQKIDKNKFKLTFRNSDAEEETRIIDLNKKPRLKSISWSGDYEY